MGQPQEQQLQLLVEQIPAIVWTADVDGRITSVAGGELERLGLPGDAEEELDPVGTGRAGYASLSAHQRALSGERTSYSVSWRGRVYECHVEPYRGETGIVGSIGVGVDVSEERRAEREVRLAYEEAIDCVVRAVETRDVGSVRHVERMSHYCLLIARELDLDPEERHTIALASRLHDVGKIAVPDAILLKEGALTDEERAVVERHCTVGYEILSAATSRILEVAAEIALTHHEWFDGSGYPQGLAGTAIPLPGRIAAIADTFDALTSNRPYRRALTLAAAKEAMLEERGTHFDPELLDLFLAAPGLPRLYRDQPRMVERLDAILETDERASSSAA